MEFGIKDYKLCRYSILYMKNFSIVLHPKVNKVNFIKFSDKNDWIKRLHLIVFYFLNMHFLARYQHVWLLVVCGTHKILLSLLALAGRLLHDRSAEGEGTHVHVCFLNSIQIDRSDDAAIWVDEAMDAVVGANAAEAIHHGQLALIWVGLVLMDRTHNDRQRCPHQQL